MSERNHRVDGFQLDKKNVAALNLTQGCICYNLYTKKIPFKSNNDTNPGFSLQSPHKLVCVCRFGSCAMWLHRLWPSGFAPNVKIASET